MKSILTNFVKFSLILCSFLLFSAAPVSAAARDITPTSILSAVNQVRTEHGLGTLLMNEKLGVAAYNKGANMQTYGYWAHTNPATQETGWMFIQQAGYQYMHAGENLAKDYTSLEGVMRGWMNSPTHKSVLLSDKYTETGIGVLYYTQNGVEKALVVELFAKPAPARHVFTTSVSMAFAGLLCTMTL